MYTLSLVPLLLLHTHPRCSTSLLSILISNPFRICQINSATNTQVPSTYLFILQRNHGMLLATFHNCKHILDIIMHIPAIILPRSTKQHMKIVHVHNITQHLILILPNLEINKAFLAHFQSMLTLKPTNPIRIRMSHSSQTKFLNHLLSNKVFSTTTIHNHSTNFTTDLQRVLNKLLL